MKRKKLFLLILTELLLSGMGLGWYASRLEFRDPVLEVYFFHMNRGRSIFIRTPHGKTLLIDGGQNGEVIRELTKVLPFYRRRIDTVMFTSAGPKSVGGLVEVLERYKVANIMQPGILGTSTAMEAFEKMLMKKALPTEKLMKGDEFEIDGVTFTVLFPALDYKYNKTTLPELAFKVDFGSTTLLFLGDISKTVQKMISKEIDEAYLIEFAHGATKSRVSADLVSKLQPKVTVSSKREETLRYEFR